ncbi:MAG: hypothetical protein KC420_14465, partial [Myxococcales bacterium]|nr:hypothetical protein [Myxococcales bacterium]
RHLHEQQDPLYGRLATIHNLFFFHQWVGAMRWGVRDGRFGEIEAALAALVADDGPEVAEGGPGAGEGPLDGAS